MHWSLYEKSFYINLHWSLDTKRALVLVYPIDESVYQMISQKSIQIVLVSLQNSFTTGLLIRLMALVSPQKDMLGVFEHKVNWSL